MPTDMHAVGHSGTVGWMGQSRCDVPDTQLQGGCTHSSLLQYNDHALPAIAACELLFCKPQRTAT